MATQARDNATVCTKVLKERLSLIFNKVNNKMSYYKTKCEFIFYL